MRALFFAVDLLLTIYTWIMLAYMLLYWLVGFSVVDKGARWVAAAQQCLSWLAEPVLRPLRVVLPEYGRVDGSPLLAVILAMAMRYVIAIYILPRLAL